MNKQGKSQGEAIFELIVILIILLSIPATAVIIWNIVGAILTTILIAGILAIGVFFVWLFFFREEFG